jgi:Ca2+:H+ antiporter
MPTPLSNFKRSQKTVAIALVLVAAAVAVKAASGPEVAIFVVAAMALASLAAVVGESIDQVGERLGPGPTGLLQSSLGNLPELLVGIFALRAGLTVVVQSALVGSVLSNVLLVLGLAFWAGGARHGVQRFDPEAPRMLVTLLALAVGALLVPTLAFRLHTPASTHSGTLSDVTAIVLLLVYAASIPFWLSGGPERVAKPRSEKAHSRTAPPGPAPKLVAVVAVLAAASLATALVSDWFVASLTPATRSLGISPAFTGLIIVAIASNAVEHAVGVQFAWKARPDFAISTILNSALQVALLLTPVLVLTSSALGPAKFTLVFPMLLVAALAIAVVVVAFVVYDGEYSWLEGTALVALYAVVAAAFWWG